MSRRPWQVIWLVAGMLAASVALGAAEEKPAAPGATGAMPAAPAARAIRAVVALIPGRVRTSLSIGRAPAEVQLQTNGVLLFWTTPAEALWLTRAPGRDERSGAPRFPDVPNDTAYPARPAPGVDAPSQPQVFRDVPQDPSDRSDGAVQPGSTGRQHVFPDVGQDSYVIEAAEPATQYRNLVRSSRAPVALRTAGGDLQLGGEQTFDLSLSGDGPRAYLELQDGGLYRRVELADRDGYQIKLHVGAEGNDVALEMTRKAIVGGKVDPGIGAMVGKPSVVKTVCSLTAPLTTGMATVVLWGMSDEALKVQPDQPSLAVVLMDAEAARRLPAESVARRSTGVATSQAATAADRAGLSPIVVQAGPAAAAAPVPADPFQAGGRPSVLLRFTLYDVPAGTPEWKALLTAKDLPAALQELADKGGAKVVAKPSLTTLSGVTGTIRIAEREADSGAMAGGDEMSQTLRATPTVQPDGKILLVVDAELGQWVRIVDAGGAGRRALSRRMITARMLLAPGHVAVLRGLGRVGAETYDYDLDGALAPAETFVTIEASLAPLAPAPPATEAKP